MNKKIRDEVMAEIITFMRDAKAQGKDPWKAAESNFPGIPTDVIAEAWCQLGDKETEAWWQTVEKTIDGEIIRRTLVISKA